MIYMVFIFLGMYKPFFTIQSSVSKHNVVLEESKEDFIEEQLDIRDKKYTPKTLWELFTIIYIEVHSSL